MVLNKTDLEWCTGTENDNKLRKKHGRIQGEEGVDWVRVRWIGWLATLL